MRCNQAANNSGEYSLSAVGRREKMGRKPCCGKEVIRGTWSAQEDKILVSYIKIHGEGKWADLPRRAGLRRCGKSCRLRWLNYLRPHIKRGNITEDEDDLIIRLHKLLGNRWTLIAGRLPGRTDNEIKNYWNTNLRKRVEGQDTALKSSQKLIKPTQNQEIHRPTKHKVISPLAVRLTESKVLPALRHYVSINDKATFFNPSSDDHSHKSSNSLMDFDIGDFLSPHQQKEINSDFDDDNCYAVHTKDMTGDVNFPSLPIETCKSAGKETETNFRAVTEPLQENDWDLEAIASFLCLEDVHIC